MYNPYAFFDVDSLELSPNGRIYVCHPQVNSISEELYEVYSVISSLSAPLVFSVDVNRNTPSENNQRCDFLSVPMNVTEEGWKESVSDWLKFYINRQAHDEKEVTAIFNNNKNAIDCIKLIKAKEWIVFGNGIEHSVDHVMNTLLDLVGVVKFVPELIVPAETESKEQLISYCQKWEEKGAISLTYDEIIDMANNHKY